MSSVKRQPFCLGFNLGFRINEHEIHSVSQELCTWLTLCCSHFILKHLWFGIAWFYPYSSRLHDWQWGNLMCVNPGVSEATLKNMEKMNKNWWHNHNKALHKYLLHIIFNILYQRQPRSRKGFGRVYLYDGHWKTIIINSLRLSDAYMCHSINHHCFR